MITGRGRFNLYLLLALVATVACGCQTHNNDKKKSKALATLRVHLEAGSQDTGRSIQVPIYRASPVQVQIQNEPFLSELQVSSAKVVDVLGGFDLQIQFNREGTWLLQQYSANNRGRRFAIFTQFGEKGRHARWLAAPAFSQMISSGMIQFTPDTSREEADEIAIGLNNSAKKNEADMKW